MQQTLHILRKDIRYLRLEIVLVVLLASIFVWMERHSPNPWWIEIILPVSAGYLLVKLIHAEAIPGDNRFWITRPYRWKSLLSAKLLFIVLFVSIPLGLAQAAILKLEGFELRGVAAGLVWSQVLMLSAVWAPVAAIATVTPEIGAVLFAALGLLAFGFGALEQILRLGGDWPQAINWMRDSVIFVGCLAASAVTLYLQYNGRRTMVSRVLIGCSALVLAFVYWRLPWPVALAAQTRLSQAENEASAQLVIDPKARRQTPAQFRRSDSKQIRIDIPVSMRGVPDGVDVRADGMKLTLSPANSERGEEKSFDVSSPDWRSASDGATVFDAVADLDTSTFSRLTATPLKVRAKLYYTLFGRPETKTFALTSERVNVTDDLQCSQAAFGYVTCRSAFRWPTQLIYAKTASDWIAFTKLVSYSPFPAPLNMNAIKSHSVSGVPVSDGRATLLIKRPIAHLCGETVMDSLNLRDFTLQ